MVDYYEVLNLNRIADCDSINEILSELEAKWIRRETINPDEARKMLTYISDAKKVFKDEASRREYDRQLMSGPSQNNASSNGPSGSSGPSQPMPNPYDAEAERQAREAREAARRSEEARDWTDKAIMYYNNRDFDLALESIEEAFNLVDPSDRDDSLYELAAEIYYQTSDFDTALKYINKAIAKKGMAKYYNRKADMCLTKLETTNWRDSDELQMQMKSALNSALKTKDGNSRETNGIAYGLFAAYYWHNEDYDQAKKYANRAIKLGDKSGFGKRIAKSIKQKEDIKKYSSYMPYGFVAYFIAEALVFFSMYFLGQPLTIVMLLLALCANVFLNYSAAVYPYGGRGMPMSVVIAIVLDIASVLFFQTHFNKIPGSMYVSSTLMIIMIVIFIFATFASMYMGTTKKRKLLS